MVLTDSGDIFILHEYQTRRMTSKQHDVAKIEVIGGHLDPKVISRPSSGSSISSPSSLGDQEFGFKLVEKGGQELKVQESCSISKCESE